MLQKKYFIRTNLVDEKNKFVGRKEERMRRRRNFDREEEEFDI